MNPPWWLGNSTASWPSASAVATDVRPVSTSRGLDPKAITTRVGAAAIAAKSGRYAVIAFDTPDSSGSSREPSSSTGMPIAAGSGADWAA